MRELIEIVIKVFAAYLAFSTIENYAPLVLVPGAVDELTSHHIGFVAAGLLVPVGIGVLLWLRAKNIAEASLPSDVPSPAVPESGIVSAGVFLIGVYWFVRSLSVLLTQLGAQTPINYGWGAVLVLSTGLILGSNLITRIFQKMRTAGTNA